MFNLMLCEFHINKKDENKVEVKVNFDESGKN